MNVKVNPDFWPEGVPYSIEYPVIPLHEVLKNSAKRFPNNAAITFMDRKISYIELDGLADRFATALHTLGVRKGDKVALFLPNMPQFIIAYYGVLRAGGVVTAISPLNMERELEHQLNDSGAETIVVGWGPEPLTRLFPLVMKIRERTGLKRVIVTSIKEYLPGFKGFLAGLLRKIPPLPNKEPGVYYMEELLEGNSPNPPKIDVDPKNDIAVLQYTGGTTGTPKGAILTNYNLVSNALMCSAWLRGKEGEEVFLGALPFFHIYGVTTALHAPIYLAGEIIPIIDPGRIEDILNAIQKCKVTVFCGVPTMYLMLINYQDINRYDLSSIRYCLSGAAPLPPEIQKRFMEITGGVLIEGYGLTEASPVTHANPLDETMESVKIGSIGLTWPDTEAKIVDLDTEEELDIGEVGELVVKGPQVMKGYWQMAEETADVLKDGWLHTGDIAKVDEDGFFYIVDRKKDLLKYMGYSVYPREIEDIIYEHPAVKQCAVLGKPDKTAGEIPVAYVVLKEGAAATEEELINFVRDRISPYKRIRGVVFRDKLPLTMVGKVLKRELMKEFMEENEVTS